MRAWVLLAAMVLGCGMEPPGADEAICLWSKVEERTAPEDGCARFIGSQHMRLAQNACEAASAPECVILQPGETRGVYADQFGDDEGRFTRGSCETLRCP